MVQGKGTESKCRSGPLCVLSSSFLESGVEGVEAIGGVVSAGGSDVHSSHVLKKVPL